MPYIAQKVRVVETGEVFVSARAAAKAVNGQFGAVYACLRGDRFTHQGYHFEYVY